MKDRISPKITCIDCGPTPTSHTTAFLASLFVVPLTPLGRLAASWRAFLGWLTSRTHKDKWLLRFIHLLARLHLGHFVHTPAAHLSDRAKVLWQEARVRAIDMYEFRPLGYSLELFIARHRERVTVFQNLPRPHHAQSPSLYWMDDKSLMRIRLQEAFVPIARGGTARNLRQARALFSQLTSPLVVKPRLSSRGRHVHVHLSTAQEFLRAYTSARKLSPWVMIEEELQGDVHRILMIKGEMVAAARRNYPFVRGDGTHTIRELVMLENQNPLRRGSVFHPIPFNSITDRYLSLTKRTWDEVPALDEIVYLDRGVIRERGGLTEDVTEEVHPDNKRLFERIARNVDDPLIGIDFIASDITHAWHTQERSGVIELNALPFIDLHHYCVRGTPRNVAAKVWDMVFPESFS